MPVAPEAGESLRVPECKRIQTTAASPASMRPTARISDAVTPEVDPPTATPATSRISLAAMLTAEMATDAAPHLTQGIPSRRVSLFWLPRSAPRNNDRAQPTTPTAMSTASDLAWEKSSNLGTVMMTGP